MTKPDTGAFRALLLAMTSSAAIAACATAPAETAPVDVAVPPAEMVPEASSLARAGVVPQQAGDDYYVSAKSAVQSRTADDFEPRAKNVILFVGDGMGVSTITAGRIYAGQQKGLDGESYRLAMESLPYSAFSKTYSHDAQVADSASTATAMMSGIKTLSRTLQSSTLRRMQALRRALSRPHASRTPPRRRPMPKAPIATGKTTIRSVAQIVRTSPASLSTGTRVTALKWCSAAGAAPSSPPA